MMNMKTMKNKMPMEPKTMGMVLGMIGLGAAATMIMRRSR